MSKKALFQFYSGDDYALEIVVFSETGELTDLTGYTFHATIKDRYGGLDDEAYLCIDTIPTVAKYGLVHLHFPNEKTRDIPAGVYAFDLQMVSPNDVVRTLLVGRIRVLADVTYRVRSGSNL